MQELRTATDLALRATKVTAWSLGQTMSTLVIQKRHLWLDLADMGESDKHCFLDSPISQAGLFGDAVESFAQQFSVAQKRTEAVGHILPWWPAAVITPPPVAAPPPAHRRRRPPAAPPFAPAWPQQQASLRPQRGAGSRKVAQPVSFPARPVKCQGKRRSWNGRTRVTGSCSSGDGESAPSPGGGPGGKSFFPFLGCSATGSPASGTQTFRAVSYVPKGARTAVHGTQSRHPRPPLLSPVGSRVRSEDAMPSPVPPAQPWSQVSVAPRTQTPLRDVLPSESGPCAPLHCPTVGTSVAPLVPLVRSLGAWLTLPRPSPWLLRTIRLSYTIQFARCPPKFRGVQFTSVLNKDAPVLRAEMAVLLAKDVFQCIRPFDWFTAIVLKDAYFHVSIPPQHRPFLRFTFEWRAYQYKVLPFGHLSRLGLRVNWERSKLSHRQRISFLGMELDSVNLTARLSIERAQSILNCLESFQRKSAVPLKHFQRLLGHMASAAAVTPLGLLHM